MVFFFLVRHTLVLPHALPSPGGGMFYQCSNVFNPLIYVKCRSILMLVASLVCRSVGMLKCLSCTRTSSYIVYVLVGCIFAVCVPNDMLACGWMWNQRRTAIYVHIFLFWDWLRYEGVRAKTTRHTTSVLFIWMQCVTRINVYIWSNDSLIWRTFTENAISIHSSMSLVPEPGTPVSQWQCWFIACSGCHFRVYLVRPCATALAAFSQIDCDRGHGLNSPRVSTYIHSPELLILFARITCMRPHACVYAPNSWSHTIAQPIPSRQHFIAGKMLPVKKTHVRTQFHYLIK